MVDDETERERFTVMLDEGEEKRRRDEVELGQFSVVKDVQRGGEN